MASRNFRNVQQTFGQDDESLFEEFDEVNEEVEKFLEEANEAASEQKGLTLVKVGTLSFHIVMVKSFESDINLLQKEPSTPNDFYKLSLIFKFLKSRKVVKLDGLDGPEIRKIFFEAVVEKEQEIARLLKQQIKTNAAKNYL